MDKEQAQAFYEMLDEYYLNLSYEHARFGYLTKFTTQMPKETMDRFKVHYPQLFKEESADRVVLELFNGITIRVEYTFTK